MQQFAKHILSLAKEIQADIPKRGRPPDEGFPAESEQVLPFSIVRGTRGYIEKVVNQINGSYENGWFDACAVMMRRLIETLVIEAFEAHNMANKIKNANGDFFYLRDLVDRTLAETAWNLGRNVKKALPRLKDIGDRSAHSRRFNAHYKDVEKILDDFRIVVQELVYLAKLK
jgi:hypothetical protein